MAQINLLDLFVRVGVDDQASDKVSSLASSFKSGLSKAASVAGAATTAAMTAATGAVVALTKQSVEAYGEYEQLTGGVETLFKTSADKVMEYADNAYKAAGMSANEYMSTVTGFSASLLQSMGGDTEAAAEKANTAISDMSDNANKMGSDMESIQNAYSGFAKQNYTMLDNLKLGYGGTASEMERLIKDAEGMDSSFKAARDETGKLSMSYSDIIDAIHIVQTNMGITGTTAKEASTTIEGSLSSAKAAWQNLVVGIADGSQDFGALVDNFVDSVATAGDNLIPRVQEILNGIIKLVSKLFPKLADMVVKLIPDILPTLLDTATNLFSQVLDTLLSLLPTLMPVAIEAVMTVVDTIIEKLPLVLQTAVKLIAQLVDGISEALPTLIPAAVEAVITIVNGLIDNLPMILDAALQLITGLAQGILDALPVLIEALPQIITGIVDFIVGAIPQIIDAGIQLLTALVAALPDIITSIVAVIPQIIDGIITAIISAIPQLIDAGIKLLISLVQNLPTIITTIVAAIPQIIDSVINALINAIPQLIVAGVQLFVALIENLPTIIVEIVKAVPQIIAGIVDAFGSYFGNMAEVGGNLLKGLWQGISDAGAWLWDQISGFFGGIVDGIKDFFGIHSPSKLFANLGGFMAEGLGEGFGDEMESVSDDMQKAIPTEFDSVSVGKSEWNANKASQYTDNIGSPGVSQPILVVVQLEGGIELGRTLIDLTNQAKRADGMTY